ncbi:MAG: endonuclease MutS2 [Oscillospiraceae bacterium]|nr:endonuclease MutS2 [Oscillospiraceae bacterium]
MNALYEKSLHTLELDRVLELLAGCCVTEEGKERAKALRPTDDADDVRQLLKETTDACHMVELKGSPGFRDVKNVKASLERADRGGSLNTVELLRIGGVLRATRSVKAYGEGDGVESGCLSSYFYGLMPNKYLEEKIFSIIINEDEIADSASSALSDIRRHMRVTGSKVRESLQKIISSPTYSKFLREPIITLRGDRYVVPVRSEFKNSIPGMVHDVSSSGGTFFIEPMQAVQANNELRELLIKEKKEIERILAELSAEVAAHREQISESYDMLIALDLIFGKARLSYSMKAMEPQVNTEGKIVLNKARHPLIDPKIVVPITVRLGEDFDTLVITGPNTGGKTVTLKTIGLLTLMAECGLHIPAADQSCISTFETVLADIGDEQSIEQSLSTFSSHMKNITEITACCDDRTLVLFDELGAGTDPAEGAALAVAIIEFCRKLGARIAATTHYGELKLYAMRTDRVINASCEFDVETLRPTYRLLIGIPGKSNAFAISRRLGLSELIIDDARSLVSENDVNFEDVLSQLEAQRQAMEQARIEAEQLRLQMEKSRRQSEEYALEIKKERDKAVAKARKEAQTIIDDARRSVNIAMDEIKQMKKQLKDAGAVEDFNQRQAKLRGELNQAEDKLSGGQPKTEKKVSARPPRQGDTVELLKLGTRATVLQVNKDGTLQIQAGIMKLNVKPSEVYVLPEQEGEAQVKKFVERANRELRNIAVSNEVDLRGMSADEAINALDLYLDNALRAKLSSVRIIHGKGTGVLRKAVQQHLKRNKRVKSVRLGVYGEGEDGVTIAELDP